MITRVLFVDTDAQALARIKKALEQAGPFEASVFVTGGAALEHAADQPPALAVIALNLTDMPPTDLVQRLRAVAPGLPVLLRAPADADQHILESIGAVGLVEGGYTARTLIPLLQEALEAPARPSYPPVPPLEHILPSVQRQRAPHSGHPDDDMSTFDEILDAIEPSLSPAAEDPFHQLVESMRGQQQRPPLPERHERLVKWANGDPPAPPHVPPDAPPPDRIFERLAAEEPAPSAEAESGTVSDLIDVTDFRREQADTPVADIPDDMILAFEELTATDEQRDLLTALSAMDQPPSQEIDLNSLPDSLKAAMIAEESPAPSAAVAQPSQAYGTTPQARSTEIGAIQRGDEAAALALELTEQTLDSAAQASVLVRAGQIIASAGELALSDLAALVEMVDCEKVLDEQNTKLKLIALPDQHVSYMVVAAPSVDNLVLLSIFPEHMPLGAIHSQAKTIMRALDATDAAIAADAAVAAGAGVAAEATAAAEKASPAEGMPVEESTTPEGDSGVKPAVQASQPAPAPEDPRDASPSQIADDIDRSALASYAVAWLLRDPAGELTSDLVDALPAWLHRTAAEHGWAIDQLDIQPDYVSLVVGITADDTPAAMASALMHASASHISAAQPGYGAPATIWADAYYVVAPGRPLSALEISQFISYQRQH